VRKASNSGFNLSGLPTAIGSLPHTDPRKACSLVAKYLPEIPFWPQLPKRSFLENMYAQYSDGFPGLVIDKDRIYVNLSQGIDEPLEKLYTAYLENRTEDFAISKEYAAGLHEFIAHRPVNPIAVKGQVTGPVTWGMTVTDENRRPILYDDTAADAAVKHLNMKARWQESKLRELSDNTIIFFDEPYMSSIGSAFVSIPRERVIELLEGAFEGITNLKGIHCCGNTDWSILLNTSVDIISFDAYNYCHTIALYTEVRDFIERGGVIAWGIVPREDKALQSEAVKNLMERLTDGMAGLERQGISKSKLLSQSLLTPACGLEPASEEAAEHALELLADLSLAFRKKYIK
jgi:methionine synthase II (cobalamin-independent)